MAQAELSVKVRPENAWLVQPGDKLVLGFSRLLDMAEVDVISNRLAELLPGVKTVIIDGVTHMAVYKPGETAEAAR
jgi:hypothetical protein